MIETTRFPFRKRAAVIAVASCLSLAPCLLQAASLGKLTVYSALGQPLRAEMEIGANREELLGMSAKLAPADVFSQTGVDMSPSLRELRFAVEKRPNGKAVLKVSSVRPISEPFLDLLVELNWSAGRLVREYTFLLDPPELASKGAAGQMSVAEAKVVETVRGGQGSAAKEKTATIAPAQAKAESTGSRVVKTGETLRKIAVENKPDGVSLEQMLVALFKNNQDAFIGKNINRLKAGAILEIPDQAAVESVSEGEARKVYVAQAADWNAYRQKLAAVTASSAARDDGAGQSASGKIAAKLEEKTPAAEQSKDQVKVSKTETSGKGGAAGKAAAEVDQIAKDRALKEAQERLALLEKNVGDLQKLLDMKSQKLAQLEQANTKKEDVKPVEPPKAPEVAAPVAAVPQPEAAKPVEVAPPAPDAAKAPEPPKPPEAPKPPPAPVEAEPADTAPGILDGLTENPLLPIGGAGILALLGAYFAIKRRRQQPEPATTTAAPSVSGLGPNSVFRTTGGQSVDTANTPPHTGDFSQMGPGTIDTDEVDPVAEADVYMAYGRDTQAEEILLEAMQKDPQRTSIHTKLLEIYAGRKSVKQFETLASELYAQTGGTGPEWAKVSALGRTLSPDNPLYSGSPAAGAEPFDADATLVVTPEDIAALNASEQAAISAATAPVAALEVPAAEPFEIQAFEPAFLEAPAETADDLVASSIPEPVSPASEEDDGSFAFDLGSSLETAEAAPLEANPVPVADSLPAAADVEAPYIDTVVTEDGKALDYVPPSEQPETAAPETPEDEALAYSLADEIVDPASVDLDFTQEAAASAAAPDVAEPVEAQPAEVVDQSTTSPDFSPEGTLVTTGSLADFGVDTFVGLDESTTKSAPEVVTPAFEAMPAVDFDLHAAKAPEAEESPLPMSDIDAAATVVSPVPLGEDDDGLDFDIKLTDSVFLGEPSPQDFDIGSINLDLSAESSGSAELPTPKPAAVAADPLESGAEEVVRTAHWEEVNTKLDLAKAYEEMGDLEGARELLQEVAGEGTTDLVEEARSILARIGG